MQQDVKGADLAIPRELGRRRPTRPAINRRLGGRGGSGGGGGGGAEAVVGHGRIWRRAAERRQRGGGI